jgi:hypothetical protein
MARPCLALKERYGKYTEALLPPVQTCGDAVVQRMLYVSPVTGL